MASAALHVILSSSDSEEEVSKVKLSLTSREKTFKKTYHDLSSSDNEDILPLRERLKRAKLDEKLSSSRAKEVKGRAGYLAAIAISSDDDDDDVIVNGSSKSNLISGRFNTSSHELNTSLPDLDVGGDFADDQLFGFTAKQNAASENEKYEARCEVKAKVAQKSDAVLQREAKKRQREETKAREKALKLISAEQRKEQKPGECLKLVKAILDVRLLEMTGVAVDIPRILQENGISYVVNEQIVPKSVTWKRNVIERRLCDVLQVDKTVAEVDEDEIIVVLGSWELVEAVHHFKQSKCGIHTGGTVKDLVRKYNALMPNKKITVLVIGMQKYFRDQSRKEQQTYRAKVRGTTSRSKKNREEVEFAVTKIDVEEAVVELQIRESCNLRFVENSSEVAQTIASFSKAVAEAPYKREKENDLMFTWLSGFDVRKSVKVDKDGNGLLLLWQRQIQQFNNVSVDMAQAIVAEYPSPLALVNAYKRCDNEQQCELMLKDIIVRRGAGPLATTRKIGRELSRKIHMFMVAEDGKVILD